MPCQISRVKVYTYLRLEIVRLLPYLFHLHVKSIFAPWKPYIGTTKSTMKPVLVISAYDPGMLAVILLLPSKQTKMQQRSVDNHSADQ